MMLTIAAVAAAAAIFNAVFPALSRSTGAIVQAGASVDDRLKSDIEIVHVVGELDSAGAFADTNSNAKFEIFIWVKNVGTTRIVDEKAIDLFLGQPGSFIRIPHLSYASSFPKWDYALEGGATEWGPSDTLKITVEYSSTPSQGNYDVKVNIPNGVSDDHFFSM